MKCKPDCTHNKHYWYIPPEIINPLHAEFNFDFDPCPSPRPEGFDGLTVEWGERNWVNPPFTGGVTPWIRKAIEQQKKGKLCVIILPIFAMRPIVILDQAGAEVRYIGLVRYLSLEDHTPNPCKTNDLHPTLLFILRPK
jgi:hypothetical protein